MKNFTVTIELDCTPRMEALLQTVIGVIPITRNVDAQEQAPLLQPERNTAPTAPVPVTKEDEEQPKKKKEEAQVQKEISDTEIRSHIKACRERMLSDINGDERTGAHNALTQMLRDKVSEYGVDKASELPQECRADFIAYVDNLREITTPF